LNIDKEQLSLAATMLYISWFFHPSIRPFVRLVVVGKHFSKTIVWEKFGEKIEKRSYGSQFL